MATIKVCGSIYSPEEEAILYAQVLDDAGQPANTATITFNLFKKDGTKLVDGASLTYIEGSNGLYGYAFTAPATVERMVADVASTNPTAYGTEDIYVANWTEGLTYIKQKEAGGWEIKNSQLIYYDTDGVTPIKTFNLFDKAGNPTSENPYKRVPV